MQPDASKCSPTEKAAAHLGGQVFCLVDDLLLRSLLWCTVAVCLLLPRRAGFSIRGPPCLIILPYKLCTAVTPGSFCTDIPTSTNYGQTISAPAECGTHHFTHLDLAQCCRVHQ